VSEQRVPVPDPIEVAGRYQVVKKLGAGAFGTVYKAKDRILGRMVAIKTIRLEGLAAAGSSLDELIDRFKREAQVSAQLKHPNIVTIYDVGEASGLSYLAMEFIDGVGLDRVIASAGRLPLERAASLAAQVADALDFAHKNNVVHRDIKPANIMVEAGDRVKVTDFGIAKVTDSGDHLTITGSLLGTPSYMSPEQARGAALDGRSDLFAVGAVLYEMLAGKKAFRGDSITGLIFKIITEEPPPIRELEPSIPDEMVRILGKALAKAPDARYQSGREMADDLLALTRPGSTPTLRQAEIATAPGMKLPSTPTLNAPPTLHSASATGQAPPATMQASATAQGAPATVASARPPISAPRVSPPPPAVAGRATRQPATSAPKSNTGLLVGIAVGALVLLVGVGAAAWVAFGRRAPPPEAAGTLTGSAGATAGAAAATPPTAASAPAGAAPPTAGAGEGTAAATLAGGNGTASGEGTTGAAPPARSGAAAAPPARMAAAGSAGTGAAAPPPGTAAEPAAPAADSRFRYLDEEGPEGDGREAGDRAADAYRGRQGWRPSSGGFGTNRRFPQRERSPRDLRPVERPAVATLRHLMDREEAYKKSTGRYGTFGEMARATGFALDVPIGASSFQRKSYRFEVTVEEDGFRITAVPSGPGPRSFIGDDSGFIRAGLE
jgi:serine/threonine protein kinase